MSIFFIAEIGINHNGDMVIAKQLIDSAAKAGFDAVKFQKRTIDEVYSLDYLNGTRKSPWGNTQRHQKEGLEFGYNDYCEIDQYCQEKNILWSASAWDVSSQKFLQRFDRKFNKAASAMLGHIPLINEIASEGLKTYISTGMATLEEIQKAVDIFRDKNCPFELMHCNSTYPMPDVDANMACLPMLREKFNCNVGYSGHETSLLKVCIVAASLGATSIERHITLDRAMYGSDQAASIEVGSLTNFIESVSLVPRIVGSNVKIISDSERPIRNKLRTYETES